MIAGTAEAIDADDLILANQGRKLKLHRDGIWRFKSAADAISQYRPNVLRRTLPALTQSTNSTLNVRFHAICSGRPPSSERSLSAHHA